MPVHEPDPQYVTQRQAYRRYGLAPLTLRRRVEDGRLQTFVDPRDDRVLLYRTADLEALQQPRPRTPEHEPVAS
jgi:hypothetical protein